MEGADRRAAATRTMRSEDGETTMTAIATITHDERALLLRMEHCRRDVRHGAVQLRAGLLRPERLRRDAVEDTRMVGVRGACSVNRASILSRLTRYGGSEWRRLK